MAQTKRKRRSKHRGNAAGSIEARGKTGRRPTAAEQKQAARGQRTLKPPTWQSALVKAAMMSVLLFVLTRVGLFGGDVPIAQSALLALFALVMYTPLAFLTDRWAYGRQQRRLAARR
jgi:Flp pilus assembly protein TadB